MVQKACWLSGQGRASLQLVKKSGRDACGKASDLSMESGKLGQCSWRFLEKYLKASTWNAKCLNKTIVFKTLSLALFEHQILEHWGSDTSDPTSRMCHVCLGACTSEITDFQLTGCVVLMPSFDAQFCSVLAILHLEARTDVHHVAIGPRANAHRVLRFQKLCHATTINRSNVSVTRAMILLQTFACLPSVRSFYTCQESLKQFGPWAHRKQKTSLQPKEYQELSKDVASCGISFKTRLSRRAQQPKETK